VRPAPAAHGGGHPDHAQRDANSAERSEALIEGMRDGSIRDRSGNVYKPSTSRSYEALLERHVYDDLGARKLASVTYPDLQDLVDRLAADGLDG
jgi:integrase